uniref:SPFH domain-containing protein n=1 Tax=uncultured miscellaneous Crenarchaeota group TaxID=1368239 RepID=W8SHW6_9ARCH|nr:SPFH domain-containing protein [uncultured miscellaneous Crenarchaeota group]
MLFVIAGLGLFLAYLFFCLRILLEYQRGVIFTLGKFSGIRQAGLRFVFVPFQQMVRVDLRMRVLDVPTQDVISRDNVSVHVNAVVYYRVVDPERAIIHVENFVVATSQLAQTTLRSVLGQHELDEMLAERDKLNKDIREILDVQTDQWGIKVANVELKHVDLEETMIRAIAKQAEAERMRRAKIIDADGEAQAAQKFLEAGEKLSARPEAMQLRYLTTLTEIAGEKSSTIVFPVPIKFGEVLKGLLRDDGHASGGQTGGLKPPAEEEEDNNPFGPG